jgi:hypothetical protein
VYPGWKAKKKILEVWWRKYLTHYYLRGTTIYLY